MSGQTFAWSSSDPAVITVSSTGYATATGPGTASIIASSGGRQGASAITIEGASQSTTPPPPTCPARSEWSVAKDEPFSGGLLPALLGSITGLLADALAPASPPTVLQMAYPVGFQGGAAPMTVGAGMSKSKCVYSDFWWKANEGWQGHASNVNKLSFMFVDDGSDLALLLYGGPSGPYTVRAALQFRTGDSRFFLEPNVSAPSIVMGGWHHVEWEIEYQSTTSPANGALRWWVDGQLAGEYKDVSFPGNGITEVQLSPTWGGVGDAKRQTDFMWFDNFLVRKY